MNTTPTTIDHANRVKEEALNDRTLKASGIGYLIGDAAMVAAGLAAKNKGEAIGGVFWGLGGLVLATCGNPSTEKRLQMLYHDMGKYLVEQGVAIPKDTKINREYLQSHGMIEHMERFLYTYPSQILNSLFAAGGTTMVSGGIKAHKQGLSYGKYNAAAGALVIAGALVGLLAHEHAHNEAPKEPEGFLGKCKHWIEEKPLRLTGYLYIGNNVANSVAAYKQFKTEPKQYSYIYKIVNVASYLVANHFLSKSSKDNLSFKEELGTKALYDLEMAAAEVIATQPAKVREGLIDQMAGYLSANAHTNIPADQLAKAMHEMVDECCGKIPPKEWRDRIAQQTHDGHQPSL